MLDLLVDAIFLFLWGVVNWLLLKGLHFLEPSKVIVVVLWLVQGIFAACTLAIIGLYVFRDLKGSQQPTASFKALWGKLVDMTRHLSAITINSTLLIGWTGINTLLHLGLNFIRGEGLNAIVISEWGGQFLFGIITLWRVVKPMYHDLTIIYGRLFP